MQTKAKIKNKDNEVEITILARSEPRLKWLKKVFKDKPIRVIIESK